MAELKFKDVESLNAATDALRKNGYLCYTFIVWKNFGEQIDYFVLEVKTMENMKNRRLIDANELKIAIRDDKNIDGRSYAIVKKHIDAATIYAINAENDNCVCGEKNEKAKEAAPPYFEEIDFDHDAED